MKTTLLSILVFSGLSACAQKEKKETSLKEKFVKIEMSKLPIADFPENSIPVSGIRVIQNLTDSIRMGYAHKGIDYSIATLIFRKSLSDVLQEQVKRMYKHEYKKDGAEIFWVIKDLRFGAKTGATDYSLTRLAPSTDCSYTRFNADAYISPDGSLFKKVCTVDTVFVILNMGGGFGPDLENALRILLRKTLLTGKEILGQNSTGLTIGQITDQAVQKTNIPILIDSNFHEGAYADFGEFLTNNPSIKNYETVVTKKKKVKVLSTGENMQKDSLAVWGICKNGEIYKYYEESLIPIEKKGSGFIISGYVENTTRRNNNFFNAGLFAGIVGGAVLSSAVLVTAIIISGKPLLVKSIPYIDDPALQPVATCIDMKTGEFTF